MGVAPGDLEVFANYETGPPLIVWSAWLVSGPHHFRPGTPHPTPLLKIANHGFHGGKGRKSVCISQTRKAAQDQPGAFFIRAREQELRVNRLASVCALPWMLWKRDWLAEAEHGEGRVRAKGLKDVKENIPCATSSFLFGAPTNTSPPDAVGGIPSLPLLR